MPLEQFEAFVDSVAHRGPDGRGIAAFKGDSGLAPSNGKFLAALGHRRLSILDLSEAGAQPMASACGNYSIVYNGEIYNYIELREELKKCGAVFESSCDTEVVLRAYEIWGEKCLSRFNGMWAFAILDRRKRQIFLSRDRIGIKPLYYWKSGAILAMASEIKQFFTLESFKREANSRACLSYLATGYEIPPETFFKNVYVFPPASYALINVDNANVDPQKFWIPGDVSEAFCDPRELTEKIRDTFSKAVKLRMRSDVPVGGCLSGGLDSSAIFVEMKEASPAQNFSAFSACFDVASIDERPFMQSIVDRTQSRHEQIFPNSKELAEDFDSFIRQHDEPVGSISMYAQYCVMKAARQSNVPVLLDGQGGDELFSGYWPSYFLMLNGHRRNGSFGRTLSHLLGAAMPWGNFDLIKEAAGNFAEYRKRATGQLSFKINEKHNDLLNELQSCSWHKTAQGLSAAEYRKAEILKIHLPRLLKWEDRNSMAFSIESRVPFLDINLVELLLSAKPEMNMKNGWTKYLFRKAMNGRLPDNICWRRDKKGFETPQKLWMSKGSFHESLLDWTREKEHPASEYVSTNFADIRASLENGNFNPVSVFRLFCMDYWLKNIVMQ